MRRFAPLPGIIVAALPLLLAGCGGGTAKPSAVTPAQPTTTSSTPTPTPTPTPTKTGPGPITAAEIAWLGSMHRMHASIDATAKQNTNLTRTAMLTLGNSFSECRRVLRGIGPRTTARLRPVLTLVNKACGQFDSGAKCWATAARVSDASGAVVAGTPEEQTQRQAIDCGTAAWGDGSNTLSEAEAKGEEIKAAAG
jgi:hypothetical protein